MWPLHSRSRPLGHAFARRCPSAPPPPPPELPPLPPPHDDAPAPAPAPKQPLSARRLAWQRRLSGRTFHIVVLALVLLDLATIVADLVLVLTHSEYRPTHQVERASRALTTTSLAILSLFCVEFIAAAAVFGPRAWFSEPLHCFDVVVVVASLGLEAALFHLEASEEAGGLDAVVSLLVAARLWRLARVAYTATEATKAEEELEEARRAARRAGGREGAGEGGTKAKGAGQEFVAAEDAHEVGRLRRLVEGLRAQLAEAGVAERPLPLLEPAQNGRGGGGAGGAEVGGAAAGGGGGRCPRC